MQTRRRLVRRAFRSASQPPLRRIECFRCYDKRWPVLFAFKAGRQAGRRADLDELEAGFGLPRVRDAHHTLGFFFILF